MSALRPGPAVDPPVFRRSPWHGSAALARRTLGILFVALTATAAHRHEVGGRSLVGVRGVRNGPPP
ncbi:hypothetical protein [Streptomyces sp. cmx-4-7]|uniref:hypothetical protein n=1 Tax=Streptomyces sp. cmx-4-7 TaxID=2790939 RepID=UPI00397EB7DC